MALSDREQQMLDEIESALNEDAEFTKSVREVSNPSQKHAHHKPTPLILPRTA